jgi:hypothetical protein
MHDTFRLSYDALHTHVTQTLQILQYIQFVFDFPQLTHFHFYPQIPVRHNDSRLTFEILLGRTL